VDFLKCIAPKPVVALRSCAFTHVMFGAPLQKPNQILEVTDELLDYQANLQSITPNQSQT